MFTLCWCFLPNLCRTFFIVWAMLAYAWWSFIIFSLSPFISVGFFRGKNLVFQLDNCSRTYQLYRDILIFFYDWKPYSFLHFPSKRSIDMWRSLKFVICHCSNLQIQPYAKNQITPLPSVLLNSCVKDLNYVKP